MKIVAYTINQSGIYNSEGKHRAEPPYLDFLLQDYGECIKVLSHMNADTAALLSLIKITPKEAEKLYETTRFRDPPYRMRYIPKKFLGVDRGEGTMHPYANFSDVSQYEEKLMDIDYSDSFQRAKLAQQTGEAVYKAFISLGFHPTSLISPTNVYRKEELEKLDLPMIDDIPAEAQKLAYECCVGNWVECFQRGHFAHIYDYDINSAYPSAAANLMDLRQGKWLHSDQYQAGADYGYCKCEVCIDAPFSPIIWKLDEEQNFTPKGIFEANLTKGAIDFIGKHNLGWATIIDGWWWYKSIAQEPSYPMKESMMKLYQMKQQSNGLKRKLIKGIMSGSFYGLFIEHRNGELGQNFVAPYAAEIETQCRLKVAGVCLDNDILPINVAVDGFSSTKPMLTPKPNDIGEWRLNYEGRELAVSSDLIAIEGKLGEGAFSVSYNWLLEQINANPEARSYTKEKTAVITLAVAMHEHKLEKLGRVEKSHRAIELRETKRRFHPKPRTGAQLLSGQYPSFPYTVESLRMLNEKE